MDRERDRVLEAAGRAIGAMLDRNCRDDLVRAAKGEL